LIARLFKESEVVTSANNKAKLKTIQS